MRPFDSTSAICANQRDGFRDAPDVCDEFLLCLSGAAYRLRCPTGLEFSRSLGYCTHVSRAEAGRTRRSASLLAGRRLRLRLDVAANVERRRLAENVGDDYCDRRAWRHDANWWVEAANQRATGFAATQSLHATAAATVSSPIRTAAAIFIAAPTANLFASIARPVCSLAPRLSPATIQTSFNAEGSATLQNKTIIRRRTLFGGTQSFFVSFFTFTRRAMQIAMATMRRAVELRLRATRCVVNESSKCSNSELNAIYSFRRKWRRENSRLDEHLNAASINLK